jgi:hypothetical protein
MATDLELLGEDDLRKAATKYLRAAIRLEPRYRSPEFRRVADILVELRSRYTTGDGTPDWAGNSFAYRQIVADIYSHAGLPADGQSSIKASIRYHVGNALRERVNAEELEDAGLIAETPRQRHFVRQNPKATKREAERLASDTVASLYTLASRLASLDKRAVDTLTSADRARVAQATRTLQQWLRETAENVDDLST